MEYLAGPILCDIGDPLSWTYRMSRRILKYSEFEELDCRPEEPDR